MNAANRKQKPKSDSSCANLFLLSGLSDEFHAKLARIKQAGWNIEFDAEMDRVGFVDGKDKFPDGWMPDLEIVVTMINDEVDTLKESHQPINDRCGRQENA